MTDEKTNTNILDEIDQIINAEFEKQPEVSIKELTAGFVPVSVPVIDDVTEYLMSGNEYAKSRLERALQKIKLINSQKSRLGYLKIRGDYKIAFFVHRIQILRYSGDYSNWRVMAYIDNSLDTEEGKLFNFLLKNYCLGFQLSHDQQPFVYAEPL